MALIDTLPLGMEPISTTYEYEFIIGIFCPAAFVGLVGLTSLNTRSLPPF